MNTDWLYVVQIYDSDQRKPFAVEIFSELREGIDYLNDFFLDFVNTYGDSRYI